MQKVKSDPSKSRASFRSRVLAVVKRIPKGKTVSYGEIARRAGNPKAARAVGAILHTNYDPLSRVIVSLGATAPQAAIIAARSGNCAF